MQHNATIFKNSATYLITVKLLDVLVATPHLAFISSVPSNDDGSLRRRRQRHAVPSAAWWRLYELDFPALYADVRRERVHWRHRNIRVGEVAVHLIVF